MFKWFFGKSKQKLVAVEKLDEEVDLNDPTLRVGNSVVVNAEVKDPDKGREIGGRQGRIIEINDQGLVTIEWDSITLQSLPGLEIAEAERSNLDWSEMILSKDELTKTKARDSEDDALRARCKLKNSYYWAGFDEQGDRIYVVLQTSDDISDELKVLEAWQRYFEEKLKFPFEAKVYDWERREPFCGGDRVNVLEISTTEVDEIYGVFAVAQKNGKKYDFPFACLEPIKKKSSNHEVLDDYSMWFANKI